MSDCRGIEYGLVLEGGGARGAYQIGAWKALRELGIKFKGVVGTSVGALNGAMIVQDEFCKAVEMWQNIKYSNVMDVNDEIFDKVKKFSFKEVDLKEVVKELTKVIKNSGFDITPLRTLVHEILKEERIRELGLDYGLVTYSISDLKPLELFLDDIPDGLFEDFLVASAYLPVFKSEKLHGKKYLDGGFYNNLPIKMLIDREYKDIIVVRINGLGHIPKCEIPEDVNITYIIPSESLGGTMDFNSSSTAYNLELGYYDTLKVFMGLKGFKYYLIEDYDENYFINKFLNMPCKAKKWLIKHYGDENLSDSRNIFENIIPQLAKRLKLSNDWRYEDVYISLFELVAEKMDIKKFAIYTLEELEDKVARGHVVKKDDSIFNRIIDDRFERAIIYLCKNFR